MSKTHLSNTQISKRGHLLYEQELRPSVERPENIGKIILVDAENGHYEIDTDGIQANKRLRTRYPDTDPYNLFAIRIGHDAVFAVSNRLIWTTDR